MNTLSLEAVPTLEFEVLDKLKQNGKILNSSGGGSNGNRQSCNNNC